MADSSFSALYSLHQMLSPRVNNPKTPKKPLKPRDGELKSIADAINKREKHAVLHIRINKQDLDNIKKEAKRPGVRYQIFISEVIHKVAM